MYQLSRIFGLILEKWFSSYTSSLRMTLIILILREVVKNWTLFVFHKLFYFEYLSHLFLVSAVTFQFLIKSRSWFSVGFLIYLFTSKTLFQFDWKFTQKNAIIDFTERLIHTSSLAECQSKSEHILNFRLRSQ